MKRLCYIFSGIIAAILIAFMADPSSASAAIADSSDSGGRFTVGTMRYEVGSNYNQVSNCNSSDTRLYCSAPLTASMRIFGFSLKTQYDIPSNSVIRFGITFRFNDYPILSPTPLSSSAGFNIITQNWMEIDQNTMFVYLEISRLDRGSYRDLQLSFSESFNVTPYTSTSSNVGVFVSNYTYTTQIDGSWFTNQISQISSINNLLKSGITANVDMSSINSAINNASQAQINATNNAANQAHKDSQAQLEEQKKANEIAEEQKNFVTDTSTPSAGDLANSDTVPGVGLLPPGPVDSLLLLPVNVLNSIIQSFGGTCKPVVAPLPFIDGSITWPCMTDVFYTGDFEILGTLVGGVSSALLLFYWFKHLYKKVDRATSLETTDEDEWGIL